MVVSVAFYYKIGIVIMAFWGSNLCRSLAMSQVHPAFRRPAAEVWCEQEEAGPGG